MSTDAPTTSGTNAQPPEALPVVRAQLLSDRLTNLHGLDGNGRERTVTVEAKVLRSRVILEEGSPTAATCLGVPAEVGAQLEVGDLVAVPDRTGQPQATFEVLGIEPWHVKRYAHAGSSPLEPNEIDDFARVREAGRRSGVVARRAPRARGAPRPPASRA